MKTVNSIYFICHLALNKCHNRNVTTCNMLKKTDLSGDDSG